MGPKHTAQARRALWVAVAAALGPNVACVSSKNPGVEHPVTLSVVAKQQNAGVCRVFVTLINTGANEVTIPFSPRAFDAKGSEVPMEPWREDEKPFRELKRTTESYAWRAAVGNVSWTSMQGGLAWDTLARRFLFAAPPGVSVSARGEITLPPQAAAHPPTVLLLCFRHSAGATPVRIATSPGGPQASLTEAPTLPALPSPRISVDAQPAPLRVSVERAVRFIQDDPVVGARQTVQAMATLDPSFSGPKASYQMAAGVRVMAEMVWIVARFSFENTGGAPAALPLASLHLRSDGEDLEPEGYAEAGQVSLASRLDGKVAVAARSASTKTLMYRSYFLWPDRYVLACR